MISLLQSGMASSELFRWVLTEDEVLEAPLGRIVFFGEALEEFSHQFVEPALLDGIVIVLSIPTWFNQSSDAEQREVMADSGLALAEPLAQSGHVQFLFPTQEEEDLQACFICEQLENLNEILLELVGQFGNPCFTCWRLGARRVTGNWFGKRCDHCFFLRFKSRGTFPLDFWSHPSERDLGDGGEFLHVLSKGLSSLICYRLSANFGPSISELFSYANIAK